MPKSTKPILGFDQITSSNKSQDELTLLTPPRHNDPRQKLRLSTKKYLVYKIFKTLLTSLMLFIFIAVFYFLILISSNYKSFPFISEQIEKTINKKLPNGNKINIKASYLKFSKLSKIVIKFDDLTLKTNNQKKLFLPKIEAEFSIFNLIFGRIIPSKLKIINPEIEIDNNNQLPKIVLKKDVQNGVLLKENLQFLSQIFLSIKNSKVEIKNFLVTDAKIIINNTKSEQIILLKEVKIKTFFDKDHLYLKAKKIIRIDDSANDLLINYNCKFNDSSGLECNMNFDNVVPATFAFLHPKLSPLKDTLATFSGAVDLKIDNNYQLNNLLFKIKSLDGNFYYPQFFSKKINFSNLEIEGSLDNSLNNLSIHKLSCDFDKTSFAMSLLIKNFMDKNKQNSLMKFQIGNAPINDLEVLWPVFLNHNNIRKWVIDHINGGIIKDGYAIIELQNKNGVEHLTKVSSQLIFSGLNLKYSPNFPKISNIEGIATFSPKQVKIEITKGDVLNSTINSANIIIDDLDSTEQMLTIKSKIYGAAEDSLKHIDYQNDFTNTIKHYFNGKSQTSINIKLPLIDNLELKNTNIKIESDIKRFNNDYINKDSSLKVSANKEFDNEDFIITADLTNANINLKQFNITKQKGTKSDVTATISFDKANQIKIKDFSWKQGNKSINANLLLQTNPLKLEEIKIKNNNFANSNFDLIYKLSKNSRVINLHGKKIDLEKFLKSENNTDNKGINLKLYHQNNIKIKLDKITLANNQTFSNVNVDIHCKSTDCQDGFIRAELEPNKNIDIIILPPNKNQKDTTVIGTIDDISLIDKAFNLSNQIIGGKAKIKVYVVDNGYLQGEIKIDSGFTILKNEAVEKISKSNIFSGFKDKILADNKIKFDNLRLEFLFKHNNVDIKTLVAESNLMGITAKGNVDFLNKKIILKGLIVPGYALNKIFGIGKIPILGKLIVGEEGGGIFAVRYDYTKEKNSEGNFSINPISAIIPGGIRNIFDVF
jgi:hypothetical protein